jgi:hypothetical protein
MDRSTLLVYIGFLYDVLADPNVPLVFHNGQAFDIPFLEAMGFAVRGYEWDTLLAWGYAWPEMPKRLEWLAGYLCGIPRWKGMIKEEEGADK